MFGEKENGQEDSFSHSTWRGHWIWHPEEEAEENSYYYFRKEFQLEDIPAECLAYITADTRYELYLNGKRAGKGPPASQPFFIYLDRRDVTELLRKGKNCVAIVANYRGTREESRGGLLLDMIQPLENGRARKVVATDRGWKTKRAKAWNRDTFPVRFNRLTPFQEHFDARETPEGWKEVGFDDSDWRTPEVIEGHSSDRPPAVTPWGKPVPRDIPFMERKKLYPTSIEKAYESLHIENRHRGEDLSIALSTGGKPLQFARVENVEHLLEKGGETLVQNSTEHLKDRAFDGIYDPCILLDFGRVITAYVELELEGPAGSGVDVGYAERLIDGQFNNALECQFADRYVMKEGLQRFRFFSWKAFRYLKLRFHDCLKPVKIKSITAVVTRYPFQERGKFRADDEGLEKIFDISRRTLRLCSHESIMDTPWREQAQWLGDVSAVTLGGIYSCFGDVKLPGKFLRQSAMNQHFTGLLANVTNDVSRNWQGVLPDYSLWWIMALWRHYLYTGEESWIHEGYSHALRIIKAFSRYINERGLVANIPYKPFIDWADVDRRGECAPLNAILYGALETLEKMARLKGDGHSEKEAKNLQGDIRSSFADRFYDEDRGCFVDANVEGKLSSKVSEHVNAAALLWNLPSEERGRRIIKEIYEEKTIASTETQPFFTSVVLQALDQWGRFDLALQVIRDRWGARMVENGAQSTYEEWGINGSWRSGDYKGFLRSLSHAWSAHPAEFLMRNLIGLEILKPGCREVKLDPKKTDFDYRVTFPTPHGPLEVNWENGELDLSGPEGINIQYFEGGEAA